VCVAWDAPDAGGQWRREPAGGYRLPKGGCVVVKQYAQVVGVVVILLGIVGLILGDQSLGGLINIDVVEDIVHLLTGALLVYVGFANVDPALRRNVVGVIGIIYLVVGLIGFVDPLLFGLLPSGYSILDNLVHLVLGLLGIAVAWFLGRTAPAAA
jgi:hypothetical protein